MMHGAVANVVEAIGNTPIVKLNTLAAGLKANIFCKLEYMNPGGSVKDRIGVHMLREAERRGEIQPGGTIIEATSGNTGMGLALYAALKGYRCIFVMADKQSMEKVRALRAVGAKVVITPTDVEPEDPRSYYSVAKRLYKETPNSFYANQYHNPDNPETHYQWTGPELWKQTNGQIDAFVAGLGTGGTISGTGRYLKEQSPDVQLVGIDIEGSVYYDFWKSGKVVPAYSYKTEGIGEDFFPSTISLDIIDEVVQVNDKDSFDMTRKLARLEGILTGGSGGSAVLGAIRYAEKIDREANIVVLLPDSATRYLNKIFDDEWMRENGFLDPEEELGTIRELLTGKSGEVFTLDHATPIRQVIELMKAHGISQVPLMDGGRLKGIVNESALLSYILDGEGNLDKPVGEIASDAFEVADPDAPVGLFNHIFGQGKVIIVWERGTCRGIITKIDVLDYLAHRRRVS
ncbi:MAG: pyridoxal-phosphate dependent enzyme [Bradymonadia bacterium]